MSKKSWLRGSFDRQDGKRAETMIQYQRQQFSKFIDHFKVIELGKVTLKDMESLYTVC